MLFIFIVSINWEAENLCNLIRAFWTQRNWNWNILEIIFVKKRIPFHVRNTVQIAFLFGFCIDSWIATFCYSFCFIWTTSENNNEETELLGWNCVVCRNVQSFFDLFSLFFFQNETGRLWHRAECLELYAFSESNNADQLQKWNNNVTDW